MKVNNALILASGSSARAEMLRNAGVGFDIHTADIDERAIEDDLRRSGADIADVAGALAKEKAFDVGKKHPDALVIGCDQTLDIEGESLSKSSNSDEAREKLKLLRGRSHRLISAVCVVRDGHLLWRHSDSATLTMHDFNDEYLESYIAAAGEALTRCVGGYELENLGARLFREVEGDYFTILGMPLLKLLSYLHEDQGLRI